MENAGILYKNRSYSSCIHEGLKLGIQNFLTLLRNVWPTMLPAVVVTAASSLFLGYYLPFLVSLTGRSDWGILMFGVSGLLHLIILITGSAYIGHLILLVRKYNELQFVPILSFRDTWPELKRIWGKSFGWLLFFWIIGYGSFILFRYVAGWAWWSFLLDLAILLACSIPCLFTSTACLFGQTTGRSSLKSFVQAFRNWGATAAVALVGGLITLIILLISWLPSAILLSAEIFSYQNLLLGDPVDLPSGFPILKFFVLLFTLILSGIALWALIFPLIFHYASVQFREEEKKNMEQDIDSDHYPENQE